jgi:hypothetical protein
MKKFFLVVLMVSVLSSCVYNCDSYYKHIKYSVMYGCRIDSVYADPKNHDERTFAVSDSDTSIKVIVLFGLRNMFDRASSGDSLFKSKGSLAFYLKKKDTTLVFYPECDG